jgi:hypothetical protein
MSHYQRQVCANCDFQRPVAYFKALLEKLEKPDFKCDFTPEEVAELSFWPYQSNQLEGGIMTHVAKNANIKVYCPSERQLNRRKDDIIRKLNKLKDGEQRVAKFEKFVKYYLTSYKGCYQGAKMLDIFCPLFRIHGVPKARDGNCFRSYQQFYDKVKKFIPPELTVEDVKQAVVMFEDEIAAINYVAAE